jgi:hypothetical protein
MGLKQIFEGWRNHIHPPEYLKEKIEEVSSERMAICRECPFNSINSGYSGIRKDEHCTKCGCTLAAKTKCLSCKCPIDNWGAEITPEEEKIIDDETQV